MLIANIPRILLDPSLTGVYCSSLLNVKPLWAHIIFSPWLLQDAYICSIPSYVQGFVRQLKAYLQLYGEEGKTELNALCTNHSITLETATIDGDISCDVKDGNLRILYREKLLGINTHTAAVYNVGDAVNTAPLPTGYSPQMNFYTRQSVRLQYDTQIEEVRLKAAAILNTPSLKFTPNFEHIYEQIKDIRKALHGGSSYWEEQLGGIGLSCYKDAFLNVLSRDFAKDEVLVEVFQDSVCRNEICLRIVGKLNGYNCFEGLSKTESCISRYVGLFVGIFHLGGGVITNEPLLVDHGSKLGIEH
jgi:hypothetical protein